MANIKKDNPKIQNNLKPIIQRLNDGKAKYRRLDYGNAVVEYLAKPENGGYEITRNQVYLLVGDFVRISPSNIYIAKAVKAVIEAYEKELAELSEITA